MNGYLKRKYRTKKFFENIEDKPIVANIPKINFLELE